MCSGLCLTSALNQHYQGAGRNEWHFQFQTAGDGFYHEVAHYWGPAAIRNTLTCADWACLEHSHLANIRLDIRLSDRVIPWQFFLCDETGSVFQHVMTCEYMWGLNKYFCPICHAFKHYIDVIMTTVASQITSVMVVYSIVYSGADQRKHQSSVSLAFVRGIHRSRGIPRTKSQWRWKWFHLMTSSWLQQNGWPF